MSNEQARSNYHIAAIRWYAKQHNLAVVPATLTKADESIVYFRTPALRILPKDIDFVLEEYEEEQAANRLAGALA